MARYSRSVIIINFAVDGSTAVDWSHLVDIRFAESLDDSEVPRLVVLMLGVNDCGGSHDKRVLALSSVQALLLLKPLPIGCKSYGVENSDLRPYADFYYQLAVLDPRITVLDTFALHLLPQDYVDWDGLHPGPTGHQKVCEYVEPVINRLLAKPA